jgi:hypothetical protein
MRVQGTRRRVVQGQHHVVVGRREFPPFKVKRNCGQSCGNFARPCSSLPIMRGRLALNERVLSMAGAGKAAAAHVVVDARHAAIADACDRGRFANHTLASRVRAREYRTSGGCGGRSELGPIAPLAATKRTGVVLARALFVLRPHLQALLMKRVAAAAATPVQSLAAAAQTLHTDRAAVVLRNVLLRHFRRSVGSVGCLFAAVDVHVGVEAAPDEFFDLRVDER